MEYGIINDCNRIISVHFEGACPLCNVLGVRGCVCVPVCVSVCEQQLPDFFAVVPHFVNFAYFALCFSLRNAARSNVAAKKEHS